MNLQNKNVLITGGAGLIGSHIVDQCLREPVSRVVIYDNFARGRLENLTSALTDSRVRVIEGDIRDQKYLARVMQGIDLVFHEAAIRITQCAEEPRLALEVLVDGTYNVLEAAVNSGVQKVVAASSASIYGLANEFPTPEKHHPYNNRTIYGAAKAFNETLLRSFNEMYGLNYVALRYFNVYGPRMDVNGAYTEVFIRWMERIAAGNPPLIFGDGTQTMDFVYVEDIARANLLAAKSDVSDEVFNIARGEETSLNDLANTLAMVMQADLKPNYGPSRKVNPVPRRLADVRKAREMLGFEARISLEEGLSNLVRWWREEQLLKEGSNDRAYVQHTNNQTLDRRAGGRSRQPSNSLRLGHSRP